MTLTYSAVHRTHYEYSSEVIDAYSVVHLLPRATGRQAVVEASLHADPEADEYDERTDEFGNRLVQLGLHRPHTSFTVVATSTVNVEPQILDGDGPPWEHVAALAANAGGSEAIELGPMLARTAPIVVSTELAALDVLASEVFAPERPILDALRELCGRIFREFAFDPAATDVSTPLDRVLSQRGGVCQDFAHLAIAVCRSRGVAARYVSGYIETDPPPGEQRTIGADASHAWLAVWVPDQGWIDLDPTNDQLPTTRHVTVAWGRDYRDVAPVRGVVIGPSATQAMTVSVDVERG
jgi:transglutaminase-like putative cysteine protease